MLVKLVKTECIVVREAIERAEYLFRNNSKVGMIGKQNKTVKSTQNKNT